MSRHVVFMGVSGSGKSSVAREVQRLTGWDLAEGDDFHPAANVEKMAAGHPLTDQDRFPWLGTLARWIRDHDVAGQPSLMSCSALRRTYRDVLRSGAARPADVSFVHLAGDKGVLLQRMGERDHFMPPELLESQLDTLEPLRGDEAGLELDATDPAMTPPVLAERVVEELGLL